MWQAKLYLTDDNVEKVKQGNEVTAVTELQDPDGLENVEYTYEWYKKDGNDAVKIDDETNKSYKATNDDVGYKLFVKVTYTDNSGFENTVDSQKTSKVININDPPRLDLRLPWRHCQRK